MPKTRQKLMNEALYAIINTYNEFSNPCHYKVSQAINAAQRMLGDTDEDVASELPSLHACKYLVAYAEKTANCNVCAGGHLDHMPDCPVETARAAIAKGV